MILLNEVKLKNFLSHGNSSVTFKDNHQMLIDGDSGAGKSSIIDAIVWCLYGRGRSDNRSLIKNGEKTASVILILKDVREDLDGVQYFRIERAMTVKGKHELKVSSKLQSNTDLKAGKKITPYKPIKVNGLKNIQEYLERQILNSSYLLFINSIVYPQDGSENFVKQTASKRKDILLEIIKSSDYDDYYKKSKKKIEELKVNMLLIDNMMEAVATSIDQDKKFIEANQYTEKDLNKLKAELETLTTKKNNLSKQINLISLKEVEINEKTIQRNDFADRKESCLRGIEEANKNLIGFDNATIDKLSLDAEKIPVLKNELEVLINSESDLNKWNGEMMNLDRDRPIQRSFDDEIEEINKQLIVIAKQDVPKCHKCMEPYKFAAEDKASRMDDLSKRLLKVKTEKEEFVKQTESYLKAIKTIGECPVVNTGRIRDINEELKILESKEKEMLRLKNDKGFFSDKYSEDIISNKKEIVELDNKIEALSSTVNSLLTAINGKDNLVSELDDVLSSYSSLEVKISDLNSGIALVKNASERLKDNEDRHSDLKANRTSCARDMKLVVLVKDAFGSNGIKSIMIDYIIPRLEEKVNKVLRRLSDFRIRLDTQRGSVSNDNTIEGLFISILNETGEEFDFDNYSGSEKLRIMYAISEGLALVQRFGFRILDETLHGFDKDIEDRFTRTIFNLQKNVDQFVCVSHLESIKALFDKKISVIKTNGNSSIIN